METQRRANQDEAKEAAPKDAPLPPTPTQAENDAAMIAATGGDAAPAPPPDQAERKPAAPAAPAHEPERRTHHERHER